MKTYKPTTKSRRQMTNVEYRGVLTASSPVKSLTFGFKRSVGRNSQGRVTMRHKGSGHKRLYRLVDFLYDKKDVPAKIKSVEYDPNRSAFIGLAVYRDGEKRAQRENSIDYFTAERALTHNTLFYNSKRERPQIL